MQFSTQRFDAPHIQETNSLSSTEKNREENNTTSSNIESALNDKTTHNIGTNKCNPVRTTDNNDTDVVGRTPATAINVLT